MGTFGRLVFCVVRTQIVGETSVSRQSFLYLRERKRKLKFGLSAVRANGDLSAVQVDDILDDVQTEACAGLVHRTRTIRLVEAVEHVRQILGGNACAGVRDRERTEVALRMGAERQPAALVDVR